MEGRYNTRSPAVKRLMKEAQELSEPTDQYYAQPLEDNLFEWHFTVRGPADSEFQNGIYHGRIVLPVDYPMKPPSIIWLTPNGRFETNKKICLSISGHHPESWQPSWSIRTALLAIIGFMPTHGAGAIGSLDYTPEERKILAKKSREWKCPICGDISNILLEPSADSDTKTSASDEVKKLAAQINFQSEQSKKAAAGSADNKTKPPTTSQTTSAPADNVKQTPVSDPPITQTAASQPATQIHRPSASYTWDPSQLRIFSPWMYPSYPTIGGYPLHQTSSAAVNSIPRFPYPPGHHFGRYEKPLMPVLSRSASALGQQESNIVQSEDFPHCNTPVGNSERSDDILINPSDKKMPQDSKESSPEAASKEKSKKSDTKEDGDGAAVSPQGATSAPKPDEKNTETEVSGLRQRSVQSKNTAEVSEEVDNGSNEENVDSSVGESARQRLRHTRVNHTPEPQTRRDTLVRRRLDFTSVLIIVLSLCTVLILLKRVLQYVATGQLI